jgi:hypothetical protein
MGADFRVSHLEKWRENDVGTQLPLPRAPTIGVRSHEGPNPLSECYMSLI